MPIFKVALKKVMLVLSIFLLAPITWAGGKERASNASCQKREVKPLACPKNEGDAEIVHGGRDLMSYCYDAFTACKEYEDSQTIMMGQHVSMMDVAISQQDAAVNAKEAADLSANVSAEGGGALARIKVACESALTQCSEYADGNLKYFDQGFALIKESMAASQNTADYERYKQCYLEANERVGKVIKPTVQACLTELGKMKYTTELSAYGSYQNLNKSLSISDLLAQDGAASGDYGWVKDAALIGGVALMPMVMMNMMDDDGDSGGAAQQYKFSVVPGESGGQCLNYGNGQQRCYTNQELEGMCVGTLTNSVDTTSQSAAGLAASGVNPVYNQQLQMAATQNNMKSELCSKYAADAREGGGADPETCHTNESEYYKQAACKNQMIAQCQDSEAGECAAFNQFYCFSQTSGEGAGATSNYCVYKTTKQACASQGTSQSCPGCLWMKTLQNKRAALLANSSVRGIDCFSNMSQVGCYPDDLSSREQVLSSCNASQCSADPVCANVDNPNFFFSWRNPGSGTSNVATNENSSSSNSQSSNNSSTTTDLGDGSSTNSNASSSTETATSENMDCSTPEAFATEQCKTWYCSFVSNQSSPTCSGVAVSSVSTISGSSPNLFVPNRYPAGSLGADISSSRSSSLLTAGAPTSTATFLCEKGELYDCGALEGLEP